MAEDGEREEVIEANNSGPSEKAEGPSATQEDGLADGAPQDGNGVPNDAVSKEPRDLGRKHVGIKGYSVSIGLVNLAVIALAGYTVAEYKIITALRVEPLTQRVQALEAAQTQSKKSLKDCKAERAKTAERVTDERAACEALRLNSRLPVLVSPSDGAVEIGSQIQFAWDYAAHDPTNQKYTVQLRFGRDGRFVDRNLLVLTPQRQKHHVREFDYFVGDGMWRVRPGGPAEEDAFRHLWSPYRPISVYPSLLTKIKKTGQLRVGITPIAVEQINYRDDHGHHQGFEVDLTNWLVKQLSRLLETEVNVEFVDIPWERLFRAVEKIDVDMAVGSISRDHHRTQQYPSLRFSDGYLSIRQRLICHTTKHDQNNDLKGRTVGVEAGTTNERAANFLAPEMGFQVDSSFDRYDALYLALEKGDIDFALVDDAIVRPLLGNGFKYCGPSFDQELNGFYREHLGYPDESYAFAIPAERNLRRSLLDTVNAVLRGSAAQAKIARLKKKWLSSGGVQ